jgi:glycosyltransferase involved in cell wall biosynthesis
MTQVLIYSHAFAPKIGGVETYVMLLAQGLARQATGSGIQVTVVTLSPAGKMDDAVLPFRVVRQPGFIKLFKLLRQAQVMHLAGPCSLPLWMAIFLHKPVVIEHHGYQAICPNGLLLYEPTKTVCSGHFMARKYRKCLRCNAINSGFLKSMVQLLLTFPRRWGSRLATTNVPITRHVENLLRLPRSRVIYYGIPDPYEGSEHAAATGSERSRLNPPVFACVGRLVSEKGIPILLQAAGKLIDAGYSFRLKIIGDGPERANLEKIVDSLGLEGRVSFLGSLTGKPLVNELMTATAVVMPSVWEETAGFSAIEQMMRGGAVIASDIGGLGEVVGEAGLKFAAGDISGLASCLRRLLDDPGLVEILGNKARERAKELFSQERMVQGHLGLYREISGPFRRTSLQSL